jgi:RNA polymerase-binding transcription factor DksA
MAKTTRKSAPTAKKKSPKPVAKSAAKAKVQAKSKAKSAPAKAKPKVQAKTKPIAKISSSHAKPKPTRKSAPPAKAKPSPKPTVKSSKSPAPKSSAAKAKPAASVKPKTKTPAPKPAAPKAPAPKRATKAASKPAPKPLATPVKAPVAKTAPTPSAAPVKRPADLTGKDAVRAKILAQRAKPAKPSAFTLDEVLAIARTAAKTAETTHAPSGPVIATKSGKVAPLPPDALKPVAPAKVKAASLADILGFNPKSRSSHAENEEAAVPEKYKRYYKLLIELRNHVTGQVDQHSEETLKRSAKEDSGDLSSYGTDGGTDSFDRDFALSLVANEQEALAEIEAAIQRIKSGNYGVCEHTGKLIPKDRLIAVPFTRYTAEAMKEIEKTRYKVRGQTGIMGEGEENAVKIDDGGDE